MRKPYTAPVVQKVELKVMNAILATCHASTIDTPQEGAVTCLALGCYNAYE